MMALPQGMLAETLNTIALAHRRVTFPLPVDDGPATEQNRTAATYLHVGGKPLHCMNQTGLIHQMLCFMETWDYVLAGALT